MCSVLFYLISVLFVCCLFVFICFGYFIYSIVFILVHYSWLIFK